MKNGAEMIRNQVLSDIVKTFKQPRSFIKCFFIDHGAVYDGSVWDRDALPLFLRTVFSCKIMMPDMYARFIEY